MELELLREIPGYKAILKSVLKAQIQLLVEQLCDQAGEESIILTASLSDGSLSHLGSKIGKGFFEEREEIKSQFLGYCLKSYHNSDTPRPRADYQEDQSSVVYSQGPSGPKKQRFHPIQDDRYSPGFENQGAQNFFTHSVTGPSSNRRNPQLKKCLSSKSSESHTTVSSDRNDNELATQESSRTETDQMDKTVNVSLSVSEPFGPSGTWSSDTGEGDITQNSNVPGTDHEQSDDSNLDSSVKIEPVTEDEELEITGIEMTGSASGVPGDWAPNVAGGLGYQSVLHEDDVLNQSGSQFNLLLDVNQTKEETAPIHTDLATSRKNGNAKSFQCPYCNKIMCRKYQLERHMKLHTGQQDYQCQYCLKGFYRRDALKSHLYNKHRELLGLSDSKVLDISGS